MHFSQSTTHTNRSGRCGLWPSHCFDGVLQLECCCCSVHPVWSDERASIWAFKQNDRMKTLALFYHWSTRRTANKNVMKRTKKLNSSGSRISSARHHNTTVAKWFKVFFEILVDLLALVFVWESIGMVLFLYTYKHACTRRPLSRCIHNTFALLCTCWQLSNLRLLIIMSIFYFL